MCIYTKHNNMYFYLGIKHVYKTEESDLNKCRAMCIWHLMHVTFNFPLKWSQPLLFIIASFKGKNPNENNEDSYIAFNLSIPIKFLKNFDGNYLDWNSLRYGTLYKLFWYTNEMIPIKMLFSSSSRIECVFMFIASFH